LAIDYGLNVLWFACGVVGGWVLGVVLWGRAEFITGNRIERSQKTRRPREKFNIF